MIKRAIRHLVNLCGYDVIRKRENGDNYPKDFSATEIEIIQRVQPYTMTDPERIVGLISAVKYVVKNQIPGDFVECGVWRGGSMMVALYTLLELGESNRQIHLFDTFQGMTPPSERDVMYTGRTADELLSTHEKIPTRNLWCWADENDVRLNVLSTGYPQDRINFIKGDVLETIPYYAPESIALLRLDTDWYESTRHELIHLFPRLNPAGVLIIDDYGHWQGAREATDEYFANQQYKPMLHRIDYTGRCAIKMV